MKAEAGYHLKDSLAILATRFPNRKRPQPFKGLSLLKAFHEDLLDDLKRIRYDGSDFQFPAPPLEGTDSIQPITNTADLFEESRVMKNCALSYLDLIAVHRQVYLYRVMRPERCTLALTRHQGTWILSGLKISCNRPASGASLRAVKQWLGSKDETDT